MNYKIIYNEEKLQQFIDWLPDLLPNEQYYITLLARKKYNPETGLKADKAQLKRFTSTKERLLQKIKQLELPLGLYESGNLEISQDNLAIYITPNPRDLHKSSLILMKEISEKLIKNDNAINPNTLALNTIQTTTSRKIFFDLDIDFRIENHQKAIGKFRTDIASCINYDCLTFIKTNGGLHCLINVQNIETAHQKSWHQKVSQLTCNEYEVTMNGDNVLPIVGCIQGIDFSPYFL
ncbi:hypothetical protein [Chryseobacterium sp. ERMR1:04]|uniref:hypothetical protein n=1 Tax=Chryseobacterium sp. ERMR1:04 TaxID=1705393 RepID=UPI0006C84CDF|nr:hypothetical protein [Chryseobacterium sp. ERMR1:04]KPH13562.1 hypothetical protein AMQ68_08310 [Chryseobacterium sp. ERMR1:04]